ncbi:MAG: hypothetical protein Q9170_006746 [Blastenia crenularia]
MFVPYATLVFGLVAVFAHISSEYECGPVSTVTVTVTNEANPLPSNTSLAPPSAEVATTVDSLTDITTTLSSTTFLTNTKVISVADAPTPVPAEDDNYYFAENDGLTTWLGGKSPTFGAPLVTNTLVVTVQPQPVTETSNTEAASSSEDETTTSFTTVSSTSFYTHYLTKSLTLQTASSPLPSANLPPHPGSYGWNATLSTAQRLKSQTTVPQPSDASIIGNTTWLTPSAVPAMIPPTVRRYHPRQVGIVVTATIDGVLVSWTNSYSGEPNTISPVTSSESSSANLPTTTSDTSTPPAYSWNANSVLSAGATSQPQPSDPPAPASLQPLAQAAPTSSSAIAVTLKQSLPYTTKEPSSTRSSTQTTSSTVSLVPSTPPFSNVTQTSAAPSATASSCRSDTGHFTIDFDDLPHFSTASPLSDIPPIFNPYRKLFFNGGYGYVPPPSDPYAPVSPPQLAVYNYHNDSVSQQSIDEGLELHGEIGAGPRANDSAYWIDAYSTWIGCANAGPGDCRIDFIGYDKFDAEIATQTLLQPPCPGLVNCQLAQVSFTSQFRDLAGLQILAYVNKTPITFYMDDLSLAWSNNTCAAQLKRSSGE